MAPARTLTVVIEPRTALVRSGSTSHVDIRDPFMIPFALMFRSLCWACDSMDPQVWSNVSFRGKAQSRRIYVM